MGGGSAAIVLLTRHPSHTVDVQPFSPAVDFFLASLIPSSLQLIGTSTTCNKLIHVVSVLVGICFNLDRRER